MFSMFSVFSILSPARIQIPFSFFLIPLTTSFTPLLIILAADAFFTNLCARFVDFLDANGLEMTFTASNLSSYVFVTDDDDEVDGVSFSDIFVVVVADAVRFVSLLLVGNVRINNN